MLKNLIEAEMQNKRSHAHIYTNKTYVRGSNIINALECFQGNCSES